MSTTRREFLKGAAAAAALTATAAPLAFADDAEIPWDLEADVVVAGCGTSGTAAAISAAEKGAEVIVIEKKEWLGGHMRRSGGGVAAAGSQVQAKFGIEDTPDEMFEYWMALSGDTNDPELVRVVADKSAAIIDWIIDDLGGQPVDEWEIIGGEDGTDTFELGPGLNIGHDPEEFDRVGARRVARCHWFTQNPEDEFIAMDTTEESKHLFPTKGGTGLWNTFRKALESYGIEPYASTGLVRLCTNAAGEVIGVVAEGPEGPCLIKARKGVVVATGNFASNHEMFKNYTGWDFTPSFNGGNAEDLVDDNDGSGINALLGVGCELVFPWKSPREPSYDNECAYSYLCAGVRINTEAQAINVFGEVVPRLYVASMAAGGVLGDAYPVCGCSVARNLIFGRIAGQNAADLEAWA